MFILTLSQLQNYQIDCHRYKVEGTMLDHASFKDYFEDFLTPF